MCGDFDDQLFPEYERGFPIASLPGKSFESSNGNHVVVPISNFLSYEIPNARTIHIRN